MPVSFGYKYIGRALEVRHSICVVSRRNFTIQGAERAVPGSSTRMLTKELKHLEEHGIINRVPYATVPPKVEFSLTRIGESTAPIIRAISQWDEHYGETVAASKR